MIRTKKCAAIVAVMMVGVACAARAELAGDAARFIQDRDRLESVRVLIDGDRDRMALDLDAPAALEADVRSFFAHRQEAQAVKLAKKANRKLMKIDLNYIGAKIQKPTKRTGVLLTDATSYITSYDAWVTLGNTIDDLVEQMRDAIAANDTAALTTAATSFFDTRRSRLEKRLQWQSDIRAMKKDTRFTPTGKAVKPGAGSLRDHVSEFLADRTAWVILEETVNGDRNNLRAAVTSGSESLATVVSTFLNDRRSLHVKGRELQMDRKAMRRNLKAKNEKGEQKPGAETKSGDLDTDDEVGALDESADTAGEK